MKNLGFTSAVCFLIVLAVSCGTVENSGQVPNAQEQAWEYNRIPVLDGDCKITDFPAAVYTPPPDRTFRSMFSGIVVDNSFTQSELDIFENRLIIQVEDHYTLYNEHCGSTFYVMVFNNIEKSVSDGMSVEAGTIIGHVEGGKASLVVFSETLDPYLVVSSNSPPVYYAGYFWFDPVFLSPSGNTRWLTFDPVDSIDTGLIRIADQVLSEAPGLTLFNQRVRFKTELSQYPRAITAEERAAIGGYERLLYGRTGVIANITEINAGGYTYWLCWQNGFNDYLQRGYSLNDDIWLYGVIVTYNAWEERGYILLRDFTPVPVEEIFEGRMKELRGS